MMSWLFGNNYEKCPHYNIDHVDIRRVDELEHGHTKIMNRLDLMARHDDKISEDIKIHNENTNDKIDNLVDKVEVLIKDMTERTIIKKASIIVEEHEKPQKDLWNRVKFTVISVVTIALLGIIGTGIHFIYDLYLKFNGA